MPRKTACCGMTLSVWPAWNMQIETTADFERIDIARHDRLQLVDDLGADQHRVDRKMRPRRVAAFALDLDRDVVGRRHHRPGADGELADRQPGIIVHAVDFLDAEAVDQAVLAPSPSAPAPPSSAGWKITTAVPAKLRVSARYLAAPSSIAVWPSWPQACILPGTVDL